MLLTSKEKHSYLIETHSEHIVLRLLRRIREKESLGVSVSPDDVSIVYLSPTVDGVVTKRINITGDGDFEEEWPDGFFDERDEELF